MKEQELLEGAKKKGRLATFKAYLRLSGPGWMQSAITLGGGSLASSLFLGVIGGTSMLWVQLFSMLLGATMLVGISYVTLSTEKSPFHLINLHINPALAWGWLLASLAANIIWLLPQFSLAYSALSDNILTGFFEKESFFSNKFFVSIVVFSICFGVTSFYGRKGIGIKIYELMLKIMIGVIVLSFTGVVLALSLSEKGLDWGAVFKGFIPDVTLYFRPVETYQQIIDTIENNDVKNFWRGWILETQRLRMIAGASAAVGINMTFLLPFSLLAKGWGRSFRQLAGFDILVGMVFPFVIITSFIVISSASVFHGKPYEGILVETREGNYQLTKETQRYQGQIRAYNRAIAKRMSHEEGRLKEVPIVKEEQFLASMLIQRDNNRLVRALNPLVGGGIANFIFGMGVLGMALSTISVLMLISGYVVCEAFGVKHGGWQHRLGTLFGGFGIFWPFLWNGTSKVYLAVTTSALGYVLLPIAFLAFFLLMNSKKVLKDNIPKGKSRLIWNILLSLSLGITAIAAAHTAWNKSLMIEGMPVPIGRIIFLVLIISVIVTHFIRKRRTTR